MAETAVSSALSQLGNLLLQEAAFLRGVKDEVEWVQTELGRMQGFLKVAESRRRRGDETVENRIREIRDVACEVEDIIDTVKFMAERQRQRRGGFMGSLSRYCPKPCELITLHKIGSDIQKIKKKIDDISKSTTTYITANLGESGVVEKRSNWEDSLRALREIPDHFFDDTNVIGLKVDEEKLEKLLVDSENKNRSVISIVGMGGLGKTTLARKVYNMAAGKNCFRKFIWLTISQKYEVDAILKNIARTCISTSTKDELEKMQESILSVTKDELEKMTERELKEKLYKELEKMTEGELKEKLYKFLEDKTYFVVMDDVWEVIAWERIGQVFPDKKNGSRVLLTTRDIEVAKSIDPNIDPYELHFLSDAESWDLFRRKALPNQDVPDELQVVGRNLAKKCGGLPLALVVLGGFMSSKGRDYHTWSEVDESFEWEFMDQGKRCLDILALSYNDLPHQLKSCFLYFAAFPEDSIISASRLARLWTAEGFIPQRARKTLEETARNFLDVLVQKCMIQAVEKSEAYGRIKSIRIHDVLREFGQSEARKDEFLHVCSSDDKAVPHRISSHRAAFHNHINDEVAVSSPHIRTLLGFNLVLKDRTAAGRFLDGLNLLRVLDLEDAEDLKALPKEIGNMIHLRYLGLRNTGLKRLPSSIGHLLNLQTLDVRDTSIIRLPKSFWKIRTLRHVYINQCILVTTPISVDHENLQTLHFTNCNDEWDIMDTIYLCIRFLGPIFIKNWVTTPSFTKEVIEKSGERAGGELVRKPLRKVVEKMHNLISFSVEWRGAGGIPCDVLQKMHCLRSLKLEGELLLKQQQFPNSIQFPPNLIKLILTDSRLEQDQMPMLEKLPNLRLLQLNDDAYVGKSMSCSDGGFPQLQHLILSGLQSLEEWSMEVGAMPRLTHLTIKYCENLKMLPEVLQHVTTLRELKLIGMSRAFKDRVRNDDGYKDQRIPSIIVQDEEDEK